MTGNEGKKDQEQAQNNFERSPKEVAAQLGLSNEVLKKYALLLEQHGHNFIRNSRNHRVYTDNDLLLLQAMMTLNRDKSMSLEDAAGLVTSSDVDVSHILAQNAHNVTRYGNNNGTHDVITLQRNGELELIRALLNEAKNMIDENKRLRKTVEEQTQENHRLFEMIGKTLEEQSDKFMRQEKVLGEQIEMNRILHEKLNAAEEKKPSLWKKLFQKGK